MMNFDEWWTETMGGPVDGPEDMATFQIAYLAWRAALTLGQWDPPATAVEDALGRVGEAKTDYEDELLLRRRIANAEAIIVVLEEAVGEYEQGALAAHEQQQVVQAENANWPEGAIPLDTRRWRCPRCNFIAGMKRVEKVCRGCGYPGDDTRSWTNEESGEDDET